MRELMLASLVTMGLSFSSLAETNTVVKVGAKVDMEASSRFENMRFGVMIHWGQPLCMVKRAMLVG